jgi:excisionase family DNA binding protein
MNIPLDGDLTYDEASSLGNVSVRTIRRLVAEGRIRVVRHNRKVVRIPLAAWREYRSALEEKCTLAAKEHQA